MHPIGKLRAVRKNELELMRIWRNEPRVRANMYTQHEISADEHFSWWEITKNRTDQMYLMYEMDGAPLGVTSFTSIDIMNKTAAWAFYAAPSAPKGTGRRMEYLMLEKAFDELCLNKLCCEVLAFNQPVINLHKKFGFLVEGVFRQQYRINNKFVDTYRLGILASEWGECRESIYQKLIS